MHVHVFPHLLSYSFLQLKEEVNGSVFMWLYVAYCNVCVCVCVWSQLTFNLGVQVIYYNLELPQSHISQVGGLQASFH